MHLASFAYNCLRLIGQMGLTGEIAPIRHPAKRRRLKTVRLKTVLQVADVLHLMGGLEGDHWTRGAPVDVPHLMGGLEVPVSNVLQ